MKSFGTTIKYPVPQKNLKVMRAAGKTSFSNDPNLQKVTTMQFWLLIFFLGIFQVSTTEIHEEKYFCVGENRVETTSRILILSPNAKYLSFELLQNVTGKGKNSIRNSINL